MNRRLTNKAPNTRVKRTINKRKLNMKNQQLKKISAQNRARIRLLGNAPRRQGNKSIGRKSTVTSAYGTTLSNQLPFMEARFGVCRIKHREPLGNLAGSVGFTATSFSVNPGIAATFPWLATIAANYECYEFNRLSFEYINRCSSTFTGGIVMAPDYDSADTAPTSTQQIEQFQNVYDSTVWKDGKGIVNTKGMGVLSKRRYVRAGALAANLDIKTYDVCNYYVTTAGQANTALIGELWVDYDVTLLIPHSNIVSNIFLSGTQLNATGGGGTTTNLLGTGPFVTLGAIGVSNALNIVTFTNLVSGFKYEVYVHLEAATLTTNMTFTATSGATNLASGDFGLVFVNGTTDQALAYAFTATSNVATFTMAGVTVDATPSRTFISVNGVSV
jgi:hypothetical protein